MNAFPILSSVKRAYIFCYESRHVWLQYAMLVMLIKAGCTAAIILADMEDIPLRAALFNVPAMLAEGAFAGFIVKLSLIQSKRQGSMLAVFSKDDLKICAIVYTLAQLAMTLIASFVEPMFDMNTGEDQASVSLAQSGVLVAIIIALFWAYRIMVIYVPLAMGISAKRYIREFNKFADSLYMMAVSLLVVVPPGILFVILLQLILPAQTQSVADLTMMQTIALSAVEIPFTLIVVTLNAVALAFAMTPRLSGKSI